MSEYVHTKAARLFDLFGGVSKLANGLGVSKATVSRWNSMENSRGQGYVPTHYNIRIMELARANGLDPHAVSACLDDHLCPCCKRPLEPGQALDMRDPLVRSSVREG